jgi:hypothetical protein
MFEMIITKYIFLEKSKKIFQLVFDMMGRGDERQNGYRIKGKIISNLPLPKVYQYNVNLSEHY